MAVALIVYGVFATVVLVLCTMSRSGPGVEYVGISLATLKDLHRTRTDLVVVDVGVSEYSVVSEALRVPAGELEGFLRWVPRHSTLVLCGWNEAEISLDEIEISLRRRGVESVYLVGDGQDILSSR